MSQPYLKFNDNKFRFSRDYRNEGYWCTVEVNNTSDYSLRPNQIVPLNLHNELTREAHRLEISEEHNFSRFPQKPEKKKTIKPRIRKKKTAVKIVLKRNG